MASTTFTNGVTLTEAAWFNDVDTVVYDIFGDGTNFVAGSLKLGTSGMTVTGTSVGWGFGVTPSAWSAGKALEVGIVGNGIWNANVACDARLVANYKYVSGTDTFAGTGYAMQYVMNTGTHTWLTSSASGTADNAATMNALMTLGATGYLSLGTYNGGNAGRFHADYDAATKNGIVLNQNDGTSGGQFSLFTLSGAVIGSITRNAATSAVLFNTTSDYRIKEILSPYSGALEQICSIPVYLGKMKGDDRTRALILAHEVQQQIPTAVTGEKDAVGADSSPKYQQMDYGSGIVPYVVAALQELRAEFQAYKDAHP